MIDKSSPIPVYYQLKEDIKEKINNGVWKVGQCIDSERELAETYEVSRMTVRQALGELVNEGVLVREKGRGTFVCEPKVKQNNLMSFSEMAKRNGLVAETKVLKFEKVKTPEDIEELLPFEEIYEIDRLRIIDNEIIAKEKIYIPCDYCGYISMELLQGSFYELIGKYGYEIDYSEANINSILSDEKLKKLFKTDIDIPLLEIKSKNITTDGKLLFLERAIYRSDKYTLEVNILRREGKIK